MSGEFSNSCSASPVLFFYTAEKLRLVDENTTSYALESSRKPVCILVKNKVAHPARRRPIVVFIPFWDRDQPSSLTGFATVVFVEKRAATFLVGGALNARHVQYLGAMIARHRKRPVAACCRY